MTPIESVYRGTNANLLAYIAPLYLPEHVVVMDVTYGKGGWWHTVNPSRFTRFVAHDLYTLDGVDFRSLPEDDGSVDVVAFDPPYVAPGGRDTSTIPQMTAAYGMHSTPKTPAENAAVIATGTGPQPLTNRDGTPRRQVHSRRAHSFLCVFERPTVRRGRLTH